MEKFTCDLRSWDEMRDLSKKVAREILDSGYGPDCIVAILRGGIVPAMNLSDLLGIHDILTLRVRHWGITATKDKKAKIETPLNLDLTGKKILLVDDLTDTGESMVLCIKHLRDLNAKEVKTATLIHKESSRFEPDFYAEKAGEWKWIILPWNLTEDLCNLISGVMKEQKVNEIRDIETALREKFNLELDEETIGETLRELERRSHS